MFQPFYFIWPEGVDKCIQSINSTGWFVEHHTKPPDSHLPSNYKLSCLCIEVSSKTCLITLIKLHHYNKSLYMSVTRTVYSRVVSKSKLESTGISIWITSSYQCCFFLHPQSWRPAAEYQYSWLLFTTEDQLCNNFRVQTDSDMAVNMCWLFDIRESMGN